ncbi:MAG: ATP-binding protein [Candidatus Phytoplasma stylosanthis]|nr:ATP-binding protein [Candidatus Phytoplasma stylosanthis]
MMSYNKDLNLKKMREFIKKNEETKNLKINDEDVIMIYNYLQEKNKINELGYKLILKTDPYISVLYQETPYSQKINFENKLNKKNLLFNQSFNLENIELKKFRNDTNDKNKALIHIQKIIQDFFKIKKGCYLYGPIGTGKTFLLKYLFKNLIQKKILGLFIFMPDLTRQFKNIWSNNDIMEKKLDLLKKTPCLILDDLGSENMTSLFRDEIFFPLLNYRYEHELITFFSSNFSLEELLEYFNSLKDFSNGIKAYKIIKIINELSNKFKFI